MVLQKYHFYNINITAEVPCTHTSTNIHYLSHRGRKMMRTFTLITLLEMWSVFTDQTTNCAGDLSTAMKMSEALRFARRTSTISPDLGVYALFFALVKLEPLPSSREFAVEVLRSELDLLSLQLHASDSFLNGIMDSIQSPEIYYGFKHAARDLWQVTSPYK